VTVAEEVASKKYYNRSALTMEREVLHGVWLGMVGAASSPSRAGSRPMSSGRKGLEAAISLVPRGLPRTPACLVPIPVPTILAPPALSLLHSPRTGREEL
jgi:hypothetical protein